MSKVNCNGCTKCCQWGKDAIDLSPILTDFEIESKKFLQNGGRLKWAENGDCIYLVETGCSVHYDKPDYCRKADCITFVDELEKSIKPMTAILIEGVKQKYCNKTFH